MMIHMQMFTENILCSCCNTVEPLTGIRSTVLYREAVLISEVKINQMIHLYCPLYRGCSYFVASFIRGSTIMVRYIF